MFKKAIIVKSKTRLEQITEQYNTVSQAAFSLKRQRENLEVQDNFLSEETKKNVSSHRAKKKKDKGSGEFSDFSEEHQQYQNVLEAVQNKVSKHLKIKVLENSFLPSFIFSEEDLIIVIGHDGLVANTAKYAKNLPIIAINPDPTRFDGFLLPFHLNNFEKTFLQVLQDRARFKMVTMAEVLLNDGQRLLAFNDFFIGTVSHTSARYLITFGEENETHSSSGIIVSTGAGATGWLSSFFNMTNGMNRAFGQNKAAYICPKPNIQMESAQLVFVVREPFLSKTSQISVVAGIITPQKELVVESLMSKTGIIFSDGLENDKLKFNSGTVARIGIAKEKAKLVVL